ncbi:MAG: GDP-L-fucose synthase, partial [Cyanobacteria bacterium P01_D01_bin.2]
TGQEVSIKDLALMIQTVVGYKGEIVFDSSKPDGTPRKLMDVSKLKDLGWQAQTSLKDGITKTYEWFQLHYETLRGV